MTKHTVNMSDYTSILYILVIWNSVDHNTVYILQKSDSNGVFIFPIKQDNQITLTKSEQDLYEFDI